MCAIMSAALRTHGCLLERLKKLFGFGHVAPVVCCNKVLVLELSTLKLIALKESDSVFDKDEALEHHVS